jgi:hypothetical protein
MSTQTFLSAFEAEIERVASEAEAEIVALAQEIGPIVQHYAEDFLSALAEIAFGAVMQQVPLLISGTEKFGNAVASVYQQVEAQGKAIAITDAQLAVQATYEKIKAKANGVS